MLTEGKANAGEGGGGTIAGKWRGVEILFGGKDQEEMQRPRMN